MFDDKEFHKENNEMKKDPETGLTFCEETICHIYTSDDECKGDKLKTMRRSGYHSLLNSVTDQQVLRIAKTVFGRKYVKKRIAEILKERASELVYDKRTVQMHYKEIMNACLEDKRTEDQKDPESEEFVEWKPHLNLALKVNDSMARTLGMFSETQIQVTGEDAAILAKKAFGRNREKRRAKSGEQIAFERKRQLNG